MKVQRKGVANPQYEVIEESTNYYIVKGHLFDVTFVRKSEYEPVQEWVDVTAECALMEDGYGRYSLFHNGCAIEASNSKYKVKFLSPMKYSVEVKR